ncbi:hypothetical protein FH972_011767 [Carpinus fangiana]|uniref:Uncharacterized protein n=1 Tax=Carpinus fangiana TaxID=176857 RepID=A0A660KZB5_9ROSI|nr:hypothetical protein FH972_011767 [Carpinus fangiana]
MKPNQSQTKSKHQQVMKNQSTNRSWKIKAPNKIKSKSKRNQEHQRSWQNMKPNQSQTKPNQHHSITTIFGSWNAEIQLLLGVVEDPWDLVLSEPSFAIRGK